MSDLSDGLTKLRTYVDACDAYDKTKDGRTFFAGPTGSAEPDGSDRLPGDEAAYDTMGSASVDLDDFITSVT